MLELSTSLIPWQHLHPILVNFTAALVPASVASDFFGKALKNESIKEAAWWMMLYAALVTPLTVVAGWFWKNSIEPAALPEDLIFTHQWLGTLMVLLFIVQAVWRGWLYYERKDPNLFYFLFGIIVVGALAYQGNLGGRMVFG